MFKTPFLPAFAFAVLLTGQGVTAEPHQEWIKFLKGEWKYEYSSLSGEGDVLKGEVKYSVALKGTTIVARGMEGKDKWVELIGWQSDKRKMVCLGYGELNNNYWTAEYDELAKDRMAGVTSGILPDGRLVKGKIVLQRVGDDGFEVHLRLTSGDDEIVDVGKFVRVSDDG